MQRAWLLLASLPLLSQQEPLFRSDTTLATVAFHVVRDKHYVDDLKIEDLVLLEDGVPRKITFFEGGRGKQRTTAVDLVLLFDVSGSVVDNGLLDMTMWKDTFPRCAARHIARGLWLRLPPAALLPAGSRCQAARSRFQQRAQDQQVRSEGRADGHPAQPSTQTEIRYGRHLDLRSSNRGGQ